MVKKTEPDVKIEDQEFFRECLKRRDEFIATAKAVLGDVGVDQIWEMYGDMCVVACEHKNIADDYSKILRDYERAGNVRRQKEKEGFEGLNLAVLEMMAASKNAVAAGILKGAQAQKVALAKKGAKAKLSKDPKQAAFREIRADHWPKWCHKKRYKAPFAREMIKLFPILESPKVIEDRCRHWEKEAATKV